MDTRWKLREATRPGMRSRYLPYLATIGILAAVYFATAKLGLLLAIPPGNATAVWPPSGIALAAVLLRGYRVWPGIWVGATLVNATTSVSLATAASIGVGNTLEALLGAYLLHRFVGTGSPLYRVQDVFKFAVLAGALSCMVAATVGVSSLHLEGAIRWSAYPSNWWTWWVGDIVGVIVVTPLLLTWSQEPRGTWGHRRLAEGLGLLVLLLTVSQVIFGGWIPGKFPNSLPYLALPVLAWTAFRFGLRETTTAIAAVAGFAIWGTLRGFGPFDGQTFNESLLLLEGFVSVLAVTNLALAAAVAERRGMEAALQADISGRERIEARFHAAFESAPTAMVMVDSAGSIILVNDLTEKLFGYARQELLGQGVEVLVPERFRGEHPRLRSQFFASPEARRMGAGRDLFGLRKDGSEFPVEIGLNPIETEGGLFVLSAIVDITERKRMEEALLRQHKWDEALTTIGQAITSLLPLEEILTRGLEGILRASGATLGLVRLAEPKTRDLVTVAHRGVAQEYLALAERIPWGTEPVGAVAATGQPRLIGRPQEFPRFSHLSLLDGWAESLACLPLQAGDRILGTLVLGHPQAEFFSPADLQAFHPAASMLAGAVRAEELRAAILKEAEERALLFRELDHRVRNNLAALISLLHLGAEGTEGTTAERLREMADRVARLAEVHNLLTGREMQPIEIRDLAQVIAKDVLTVLRADVQIRWTVTGEPIRVPPSRVTAIALILNELMTNCVKHAFPGRGAGSVHIQVGRDGDHAVLEVRDDGVGLNRATQPAGLGLGIVETLVTHNLGGTLRFAHEGGTLVTVRFPQVEEMPEGGAG